MKVFNNKLIMNLSVILILLCVSIFAGCASTNQGQGSSSQITPTTAQTQIIQTVVQTSTVVQPSGTKTQVNTPTITSSLPYGLTISYPQDWTKQELQETGVRDYGQNTINIANIFSPRDNPNDLSSYATFSIDVDPNPSTEDLEQYFNLATVALQNYWGKPFEITKHDYQLKISNYKSYRLDYTTPKSGDRTIIFTDAKGIYYIFSIKNQWDDDGWFENIYKSIKIVPPINTAQVRS